MKTLITITIMLFFSGCTTHTPFELDDETPVPVADCYISLQKRTPILIKFGSAVIVEDGVAITNRHVIEREAGMKGYMAGGIEFSITNITLSDRLDLAVFEIPCGVGKPINIGKRIQAGDQIYSAGTTLKSTILNGSVISTEFYLHHVDIKLPNAENRDSEGRSVTRGFVYEGDFRNGFSGGPIVNSTGELVGINQGKVLEFFSIDSEIVSRTDKTYGLGYHVEDVLNEINEIAPKKLKRCKSLKKEIGYLHHRIGFSPH